MADRGTDTAWKILLQLKDISVEEAIGPSEHSLHRATGDGNLTFFAFYLQ